MATDANGQATDMMLGLHFAGETVEPAEYALSCYASVFEKLEIRPPVPAGAGPGATATVVPRIGGGYDADFLGGHFVSVPTAATSAVETDYAPTKAGDVVRHYTHFSLAMSASRRFCRWGRLERRRQRPATTLARRARVRA